MTSSRTIGRYEIMSELASGGMATIYAARLVGLGGFSRLVAVKQLHAQFAKDPAFTAMLVDEARLAAHIHHLNVVPMLDVVVEAGELLIAMEYVRGDSLASLCRAERALGERTPHEVVGSVMAGLLAGLQSAHDARNERGEPLHIIHRDVSPQNLLIGIDGIPRVVDFGIAKASARLQSTQTGEVKGKLSYMAPEQLSGGAVDPRADIYSAGVMLWELLAQRRLFEADHHAALANKVLNEVPMPLRTLDPSLSVELEQLVARALDKNPRARFSTCSEMAAALEPLLPQASLRVMGDWVTRLAGQHLEQQARAVEQVQSVITAAVATPAAPRVAEELSATPAPRRRSWPGALAAVALSLCAGAGFAFWRSAARETVAPAAPPVAAPAAVAQPEPAPTEPAVAPPPVAVEPPPAKTEPRAPSARTRRLSAGHNRCNPPFTIDAEGVKTYKPECLK